MGSFLSYFVSQRWGRGKGTTFHSLKYHPVENSFTRFKIQPFLPAEIRRIPGMKSLVAIYCNILLQPRYETYLIPGETLIPGGKGEREAFHPGIGYASYLSWIQMDTTDCMWVIYAVKCQTRTRQILGSDNFP